MGVVLWRKLGWLAKDVVPVDVTNRVSIRQLDDLAATVPRVDAMGLQVNTKLASLQVFLLYDNFCAVAVLADNSGHLKTPSGDDVLDA